MTRTLLALAAGLTAVTAEVPVCDDGEVRDVEIMFSSVEYIKSFKIYLTGDATGGNGAEIRLLPPTAASNAETATAKTPTFQVDLVRSDDDPTKGRSYYSGMVTDADGSCDDSENSGCLQPTDLINPPDGGPTIENLLTVPVCFISGGDQPGPAACVDVKFNEGTEGPGPTEFVAASGEKPKYRILERGGGNAVESALCRTLEVGVYEDARPEEGEQKERGGDYDVDGGGGDDDDDENDDDDDLPSSLPA